MSKEYVMLARPINVTASSQYSNDDKAVYAFDNSTSTYWRPSNNTNQWVQAELDKAYKITSLRIYQGSSSYYVTGFILRGSNDETSWTDLYTGVMTSSTGWYSFSLTNESSYKYYRLSITSVSGHIRVSEIELEYYDLFNKTNGKYIGVEFDKFLEGDVSGSDTISGLEWFIPSNVLGSTEYSKSYPLTAVIDNNYNTNYRPATPTNSWLGFEVYSRIVSVSFYLTNTTYYPKQITVFGSDIYSSYGTALFTGNLPSPGTVGWKTVNFTNTKAYKYCFIRFETYNSSYFYVSEVQLQKAKDNLTAFSINGKTKEYAPDGALIDINVPIKTIARHPTIENAILIETFDEIRFNNVYGDLTLNYDALLGSLVGPGGVLVDSFSLPFAPEDLVAKPDQMIRDNIEITDILPTGIFTKVTYHNTKSEEERIEITDILPTGILTHINDL